MDDASRLGEALQHIGQHGDLRAMPGTRTAKVALVKTAQIKGLATWDRADECYRLTPEGYRRAAAHAPGLRAALRKPRRVGRILAVAGCAAVMACFIATRSSHVISGGSQENASAPRLGDFSSVGPLAARTRNGLGAIAGDVARQEALRPTANPAVPMTIERAASTPAESNRRVAASAVVKPEAKTRKASRSRHRQERFMAAGQHPSGALAFTEDPRAMRRGGFSGYGYGQAPSGFLFARPNGWW